MSLVVLSASYGAGGSAIGPALADRQGTDEISNTSVSAIF